MNAHNMFTYVYLLNLGGSVCLKKILIVTLLFFTESGQESAVFTETSEARASPLLQNISKRDISLPTKTAGPLFTSQADNLDQDDESDLEEVRPSSVPPEEIPRPVSLQDIVRARVS